MHAPKGNYRTAPNYTTRLPASLFPSLKSQSPTELSILALLASHYQTPLASHNYNTAFFFSLPQRASFVSSRGYLSACPEGFRGIHYLINSTIPLHNSTSLRSSAAV